MSYFEPAKLLKKDPPARRAYYSDRTSWLMAQMSNLAYFKFEGAETDIDGISEEISKLEDKNKIKKIIGKYIDGMKREEEQGKAGLKAALDKAGFKLVKAFSKSGTQAFIAKRDRDKIAVLAFRGTESTQLDDIKADLNAITTSEKGYKVHTGFQNAFSVVALSIEREIKALGKNGYSIYITGHSLGGALALVATKKLESDNTAACYTSGSPRVGNSEFADSIKTPIYRVVNTADIVPRLPPGVFTEVVVDVLRLLKGVFPFLEIIASFLDNKVGGYRHHGDMRYLTSCKAEDCSDVRLISNITFLARIKRLIKNRISWNKHIGDHSIDKYCEKLGAHAKKQGGR